MNRYSLQVRLLMPPIEHLMLVVSDDQGHRTKLEFYGGNWWEAQTTTLKKGTLVFESPQMGRAVLKPGETEAWFHRAMLPWAGGPALPNNTE